MPRVLSKVREQISSLAWGSVGTGIRTWFRMGTWRWWTDRPRMDKTVVNYDVARTLYRNDDPAFYLGGGFSKPIVDLQVAFMGMPIAHSTIEEVDSFLNAAIEGYWAPQIQEAFRNAIRDSKTIVRIRRPDPGNPLVTVDELVYGGLEIIDPERVRIIRQPDTADFESAIITHYVEFVNTEAFEAGRVQDPPSTEHKILEYVTRESYRYYDVTRSMWVDEWEMENTWGFIPLVEFWNEYDSSLGGGQSDLEAPLPFMRAFHDVLQQSLQAHKYHSIPKAMFKIDDVQTFLKNNFPDAFDSEGNFSGEVSWKGKEILFLQSTEDAGFIEAESVLGDSKTLLEFLFDCICVASETPEWAFMRVEAATQGGSNAQTLPFEKKIERKRVQFSDPVQQLLKMLQAINGRGIVCPKIDWKENREEAIVTMTQAFTQLVTGLEIAAQRKIISDNTYREAMRIFLPMMKPPSQEAKDAESNVELAPTLTAAPNSGGQNE